MRSLKEIMAFAAERNLSLPNAILSIDAEASGISVDEIRTMIKERLADMERSVREASLNKEEGRLVPQTGRLLRQHSALGNTLCGQFVLRAGTIALEVATYNATMGRIVAAPTAGSCGILPGLLFSWKEFHGGDDADEKLTDALIVAGAIGEVIAARATLAGAEGGCQAECGAAAAMGSGALAYIQGGSDEMVANAVALALKSILGLVCDPVGGLVEAPCIKRNGTLTALGAVSAEMALAGIKSVIPADEVIDAMSRVGKAIPPSLRETSLGGLAITPTAKELVKNLGLKKPQAV